MLRSYTIEGGESDADRLARQATVMADATIAFLHRAGLKEGADCLDVGCGQGQVTMAMAQGAAPGGRVVGIDIDREALEAARQKARRTGAEADFVVGDACAPQGESGFDLVFSRLVLSHLVDPMAAVRAMRMAARQGGAVAVEDLLTTTLRSEPHRPVLDRLKDLYQDTVRFHGGDPTIGPRLGAMLRAVGLRDVSTTVVVNQMTKVEEKLFLAELVDNMRPAVRRAGVAGEGELDELRTEVERAAREENTVFYQAAMYQTWGRRPSD